MSNSGSLSLRFSSAFLLRRDFCHELSMTLILFPSNAVLRDAVFVVVLVLEGILFLNGRASWFYPGREEGSVWPTGWSHRRSVGSAKCSVAQREHLYF